MKDNNTESENLSSLIQLSLSDGEKSNVSFDVSFKGIFIDFINLFISPYKPSVLFVGHRQTVQTQSLHCVLTECFLKNLK